MHLLVSECHHQIETDLCLLKAEGRFCVQYIVLNAAFVNTDDLKEQLALPFALLLFSRSMLIFSYILQ